MSRFLGVVLIAGIGASVAGANSDPTVTNVTAAQRTDGSKLVDIGYDLADVDSDPCTVTVVVSDDGGSSWGAPVASLTGDVGAGITPGAGKAIVWDCGADLPGAFGTNYKVRVYADDGQGTPTEMVLIPAGEFEMGDHHDGMSSALPVHAVYVDAFYMGRYEVTKGLWDTVRTWATSNGYDLIAGSGKAADHPVHSVNWYDCVKWCNALSQQEGRTPCYYTNAGLTTVYRTGQVAPYVKWDANGYRLPTEAEWEKAARGGEYTPYYRYPWGDTYDGSMANYWGSGDPYETGGYPYTTPVGYYDGSQSPSGVDMANGYGLYDMAGNVWEWCNDWYGLYSHCDPAPCDNPHGPATGAWRVHRGGSWKGSNVYGLRCAFRGINYPHSRFHHYGFRLALD